MFSSWKSKFNTFQRWKHKFKKGGGIIALVSYVYAYHIHITAYLLILVQICLKDQKFIHLNWNTHSIKFPMELKIVLFTFRNDCYHLFKVHRLSQISFLWLAFRTFPCQGVEFVKGCLICLIIFTTYKPSYNMALIVLFRESRLLVSNCNLLCLLFTSMFGSLQMMLNIYKLFRIVLLYHF